MPAAPLVGWGGGGVPMPSPVGVGVLERAAGNIQRAVMGPPVPTLPPDGWGGGAGKGW